jgi:hypothetical protein
MALIFLVIIIDGRFFEFSRQFDFSRSAGYDQSLFLSRRMTGSGLTMPWFDRSSDRFANNGDVVRQTPDQRVAVKMVGGCQ